MIKLDMIKGLIAKVSLLLVVLVIAVEVFAILATPQMVVQPKLNALTTISGSEPVLPWPDAGQAAIGAEGFGLLDSHGTQTPAPIASVAKVITALAVLNQKPLNIGEQGPTITLGAADVSSYESYLTEGGSVAKVTSGEQITEYQALETMLLPSANNMAFSLANWAFGSLDSYISYANSFVKTLGLTQTTVADASGFLPQTISTAVDLVKLAQAAMDNPVLAQVVAQPQADVPIAGIVQNTNWLLGTDGIIGIKTGNTDQAGGCFLFAAKHSVGGQSLTIFGAVLNTPDLVSAVTSAHTLANASIAGFKVITTIQAGQKVAFYKTKWSAGTYAIAQTSSSALIWQNQSVSFKANLKSLKSMATAHTTVGSITVKIGGKSSSVPVVSESSIAGPSIKWRLFHPPF